MASILSAYRIIKKSQTSQDYQFRCYHWLLSDGLSRHSFRGCCQISRYDKQIFGFVIQIIIILHIVCKKLDLYFKNLIITSFSLHSDWGSVLSEGNSNSNNTGNTTTNFIMDQSQISNHLNNMGDVFPFVIKYFAPSWLVFFVVTGLTAAVMSSADSAFLSSAAMFSRNIYKTTKKSVRIFENLYSIVL